MPPRAQPTARQERLGTELRKLREAAGMTAREAATLLGTSPMQMSHMETGRAGISEPRLRSLAAHYACPDSAFVDALASMATDRTRGWWEEYRGILPPSFLDLAELEHHAAYLRSVDIAHIPGLFQTEAYAAAVFSYTVPELPPDDLAAWVSHRMRRRSVLAQRAAVTHDALIHEAALRIKVSDRKVAQQQLRQLLTLSESDHVTVRVIPFAADGFAGAGCTMLHAGGVMPRLDTVQRDTPHGSGFVDAEPQLARCRALYLRVRDASLGPVRSQDFIHRIAQEL
ncbi:helix-turn-helix transcriptional regulator [Streptomyces sp. N2-109]|uniref:Helix-turn-helix transcriptional regulator n=1 Tax=Streptomyces gossypii TaxID=2883101 RepID=A0ABT2JMQ3_9ACTN|nr:helix-turn-helix transcriptional regulator [Streptomyces gossypii]MCT2589096.1 helix-turn-helix transcriptional regulator [Streptomyces gossypii]